jgi:GAF domain-containing protein/HAMP domain-containing protein
MEKMMKEINTRKEITYLLDISLFVPIFGALTIIGLLIIYLFFPKYQLLQICAVAAIGSLLFILSRYLINKKHISLASLLMVIVGALFFPAYNLFWEGFLFPLLIGVWIIPSVIAWYGLDFEKYQSATGAQLLLFHRFLVILISALSTVLIFIVENTPIVPRLAVTNSEILIWLIPLFSLLGGLLAILLIMRTPFLNSLFNRIMISFLIIVLVPVITLSSIMVINNIETNPQYKIRNIQSSLEQDIKRINNWIQEMNNLVTTVFTDNSSRAGLISLLQNTTPTEPQFDPYYTQVQDSILQFQNQNGQLKDILILNKSGIVIASSNKDLLNQNFAYREFFWKGKNGFYISPPKYYPNIDGTSMYISSSIRDNTGAIIGVLAFRTDAALILELITSLSQTEGNKSVYVLNSANGILPGLSIGNPSNIVMEDIISTSWEKSEFGSFQYIINEEKPIIAIYRWIPDLNIAIIVETSQQAAAINFLQLSEAYLVVAILASIVALFGAYITARTVSMPIKELSLATRKIADGDLSVRTATNYSGELGSLSQSFNNLAEQIQESISNLEIRVSERTRIFEKRENELKVAAEVARDVSTSRNLKEILNRSSQLIHDRFNFYHVGIFLLDEKNEYAILRAAGGEAGKLMLANRHKLKVGETGMVGFVTKTGEPRLALDTGEDIVHFNNPLLPYTRSEITLPLSIGTRIIGALDVQSDKVNAFDEDDVAILRVMADQLAIAIENGRLLQEIEKNISQTESTFKQYTADTWQSFIQSRAIQGYSFSGIQPDPIKEISPEGINAIQSGRSIINKVFKKGIANIVVAVPIKLRDQAIGIINIEFNKGEISQEMVALMEEASNRLAIALENSRLLAEAQQSAFREHNVNILSTQAQRIPDLDSLLQSTVRELGKMLGIQKTFIQIGLNYPSEQGSSKSE